MDKGLKRKLTAIGINVDEAVERMLGYEDFYIELLKKITTDDNYEKLRKALIARDSDAAFKAAHTLKGLSGDLAITALFVPLTEITDALRHKDIDQALVYMQSFSERYHKVIEVIQAV